MINALTTKLLQAPSISPNDAGCQEFIAKELSRLGFTIESRHFGDVKNLWATLGHQSKTLLFIGHTDVVPPGPLENWKFPPFEPTIHEGKLYARGAADMKVALACMVDACERFLTTTPHPTFNIAFLITSCEEANTNDGTERAIHQLIHIENKRFDWCIVGEPSAQHRLGDTIKVGRRGSLHGTLTIIGQQGHIAYPQLAKNPIHLTAPFLTELTQIVWDTGNDYFDPTSLQISNIHSGDGTVNVIPESTTILFNFRYAPTSSQEGLQRSVEDLLKKHQLTYEITWYDGGKPFQSSFGVLHQAIQTATYAVTGLYPISSTSGGTSDARFIAPHGIETIELGFPNQTIHQVNECIEISEIEKLTEIYYKALHYLQNG
ncbi:MAG: succinyl-diaminopimelate desuccinylase [Gammaproteobacteria bacterium]|nr:succinyl-diaminopimelate desuccinylase [Gammaproteobacteria bacterium]MCD8542406.1 succinyl-diaminopimelate desuccinylase [Gammaproteobacteria bacterium]